MKTVTLALTLFGLVSGVSFVDAQGSRGSMPQSGRAGVWGAPSGAVPRQAFQHTPRSAPSLHQPAGVTIQQTWPRSVPTINKPVQPGISFQTVPPAVQHVPSVGWAPDRGRGKARPHPHRPRHIHRHPGFFIVDVPGFTGTTVITQVAPGVVQSERRYLDGSPGDSQLRGPERLAPFDPTPQKVVERMLALAGVRKGDVVYDLGSGDGRFLITAARVYGVRGVGFEIDTGLVKLARENARRHGVEKLVEIREQDFRSADLSAASVVTLYLSQDGNLAVREQLRRQLKPGARVVSYTFDMGDWPAKTTESYRDDAGDSHLLYLWEITEPSLASGPLEPMLQPYPTREGPLILDVR